jgi:archaellum component FlaC
LKFLPNSESLKDALAEAIVKQGEPSLRIDQEFNRAQPSVLSAALLEALRTRLLDGKTGFIYPPFHLINCDPNSLTLEVEYQVLTVAKLSYPNSNFELNNRKDKDKTEEEAGTPEKDKEKFGITPVIGYNRSRGTYGGSAITYETDFKPLSRIDLNVSGSGSSAVVDASLRGEHEYSKGLLSYVEWRLGYKYSNIPTDTVRLKDATVLGQVFAATRPVSNRELFFRFGSSVEGGNRQSNQAQSSVPSSTLASSGYRALKIYVGASLTSNRQSWKASYGVQLGSDGSGLRLDFRKQIFDVAYQARFLPREHKALELDAQITAGSLKTVSGSIPLAERFFGGNAEREFIQGDSWRIRSAPFIRSFAENRLNRVGNGMPIGGTNFVSINLTAAQTVWQKQLVLREVVTDPDINAGLAGQLLGTRRFLREEVVQRSGQIKTLAAQISCMNKDKEDKDKNSGVDKHCLSPVIAQLRSLLTSLSTVLPAPLPDSVSASIGKFFKDSDLGNQPIPDTEATVAAAKLDPDAFKKPIEDLAALANIQNNPVEGGARLLTHDDQGDPTDPDDDTISLITNLQNHIDALQENLGKVGFATQGQVFDEMKRDLTESRQAIEKFMTPVEALRSYRQVDVKRAVDAMNQSSASGKKLDEIIDDIKKQIKPLRATVRTDLNHLKQDLDKLPNDSAEAATIRQKRSVLADYRDLLDATDTYCDKARSAFGSANDNYGKNEFSEAKFDLERLTVGFGGLVSLLSGLANSIDDLRMDLSQKEPTRWNAIHTDALELRTIQASVRSQYKKIPVPRAEATANRTVSYVGRVLDTFFHDLNLVGVAPVFMFDAVRLGPAQLPEQSNFRYGVGSGIRFSLVNLELTAGYSVNPTRRVGEGRGAFVFKMEISNLFH